MKTASLQDMMKGWFIGPFAPTLFHTEQFECAVKRYAAGDKEGSHVHRVATEYTIVASGKVRMNGVVYGADTIVVIEPGEATDFEALEDTVTFVVKVPAVRGDKYEASNA